MALSGDLRWAVDPRTGKVIVLGRLKALDALTADALDSGERELAALLLDEMATLCERLQRASRNN